MLSRHRSVGQGKRILAFNICPYLALTCLVQGWPFFYWYKQSVFLTPLLTPVQDGGSVRINTSVSDRS